MATVKGDVHDIGKNIVGVVLQCNNYEVIDLGVMVPGQKIIDAVKEHDADIVGLSGLITPSLDEMVGFASELERQGLQIPLLIGGATTSRAHTAVKVDPKYHGPVVWVKDASRSVPVAAALLSDRQRPDFLAGVEADFDSMRERHASRQKARPMTSLEKARTNATPITWDGYAPPEPALEGAADGAVRVLDDVDLAELRDYIDWQPFFNAWEMKGAFPDILNNPTTGEVARKLLGRRPGDAGPGHRGVLDHRARRGRALPGQPGRTARTSRSTPTPARTDVRERLHHLRQQGEHRHGLPHRSLADFVAPKESGLADHVGAFAVTAGIGVEERVRKFKDEHDDYSAIMLESLADRLAEAFAERLHERVRTELWGYAPDEKLDNRELIKEKYDGIRPAPGYPACPDHTEKETLWRLLDVERSHRAEAHREHGDVARRRGQRLLLLPPRSRSTSSSAGSGRTRSPTTRAARAGRCRRPSAGSRPTSATSRRTDGVPPRELAASCSTWTAPWSTPSRSGSTPRQALVAEHGGTWSDEQALELVGSDLPDCGGGMRDDGRGAARAAERIVDACWLTSWRRRTRSDVPWRPGARELLADLRRHDVPLALVTMSWRPLADAVVAALPPGHASTPW